MLNEKGNHPYMGIEQYPGREETVVTPGGDTGTGDETIDENETPLAPDEGEDIGEDETPLAPGDEGEDIDENETPQAGGMNVGAVVGGVAGVAVIVALIAWLVTRKKKSGGAQE